MCWSFNTTCAFAASYAVIIAAYKLAGRRSWRSLAFHVNQLAMEGSQALNMLALASTSESRNMLIGASAAFSLTVYFFIPFALLLTLTAPDAVVVMKRTYPSAGPHRSLLHHGSYQALLALLTAYMIGDVWLGSNFGKVCDFLPAMHSSLHSSWGMGFDLLMGPSHHVIWKYRPLVCTDGFPYASPNAGTWCALFYAMVFLPDLGKPGCEWAIVACLALASIPAYISLLVGGTSETISYWCWTTYFYILFQPYMDTVALAVLDSRWIRAPAFRLATPPTALDRLLCIVSGAPGAPLVAKLARPAAGEEMAALRREKSWPRYVLAMVLIPLPLCAATYGLELLFKAMISPFSPLCPPPPSLSGVWHSRLSH